MEQRMRLSRRLPGENVPEALMADLLESAKSIIMERRYPYEEWPDELEPRYLDTQIRIAVELYSRMGAEGQVWHSENGINRSWSGADVSPDILESITPKVKVL